MKKDELKSMSARAQDARDNEEDIFKTESFYELLRVLRLQRNERHPFPGLFKRLFFKYLAFAVLSSLLTNV